MFSKVSMSVPGVVENMSTDSCSKCGHEDTVFGNGNEHVVASGLPMVGKIDWDTAGVEPGTGIGVAIAGRSTPEIRPIRNSADAIVTPVLPAEIIALARVSGQHGGIYISHMRNEALEVLDVHAEQCLGRLVDISAEGLMVLSPAEIPLQQIFQLEIALPVQVAGCERLTLGVESLWCRESNNGEQYWAGFHVIDLSEDAQACIERLVQCM